MLKLGYHLRTLSFKFSFSIYSLFKLNLFSYCVKSVQIRSYFWSIFSCIRTEYGDLRNKSPYSVRMQQNMDQKQLRIWTAFTQCLIFAFVSNGSNISVNSLLKNYFHGWMPYSIYNRFDIRIS